MQGNASTGDSAPTATGSTLLLLFGGVLLGALDIAVIGPALPAIETELALDSRQSAQIFSVYILFALIGAPLLASLSDRFGRRRLYIGCLLLFGLGSLVVASAAAIDSLLLGRAIQAIGAGGMLPVASAVIADHFPVERRGRALGLIGAVFGLAFVLGPLIGGIFLRFSWRWLFVVNLPLVVVLVAMAFRLLEDRVHAGAWSFDVKGAGLLALGLGALAVGAGGIDIDPRGLPGLTLPAAIAFGIALLAAALFWQVEKRASAPILDPALLASRQMRIIGLLALATGLVEACMVFLPSLAVQALGVSASAASFMLLPLILALIAGSMLAGRALDRRGPKPVIQIGMGLTVLGLLLFSLLPLATASFYVAGLTVGFGLASLLGAPLRYVALAEGGTAARGASQGLLTICLGTGRLFGASLTGGIAGSAAIAASGYRRAMLLIAVACGLALIASSRLRNDGARNAGAGNSASSP